MFLKNELYHSLMLLKNTILPFFYHVFAADNISLGHNLWKIVLGKICSFLNILYDKII